MIQNINHTFPVPRAYIASCFSTVRPPQGSLPAPNRWYPLLPLNLHKQKRPGIVPHAFNPSTHPEDRGRWISVGTGPACSTRWILGQPRPTQRDLSQKKRKKNDSTDLKSSSSTTRHGACTMSPGHTVHSCFTHQRHHLPWHSDLQGKSTHHFQVILGNVTFVGGAFCHRVRSKMLQN